MKILAFFLQNVLHSIIIVSVKTIYMETLRTILGSIYVTSNDVNLTLTSNLPNHELNWQNDIYHWYITSFPLSKTVKPAVSHVTGIKLALIDRTLKIPLVLGHPVDFGQHFCYIREEDYFFYLKSGICSSYLRFYLHIKSLNGFVGS